MNTKRMDDHTAARWSGTDGGNSFESNYKSIQILRVAGLVKTRLKPTLPDNGLLSRRSFASLVCNEQSKQESIFL